MKLGSFEVVTLLKKKIIFIASLTIILSNPMMASATTDSIWVTTCCANLFFAGDTIKIEGGVDDILDGNPVSLQITGPNDKLVTIKQLEVGADKRFKTEIVTGGPPWDEAGQGQYVVNVLYGSELRTAQTTFDYAFDWTTVNQHSHIVTLSVPDYPVYYNDRVTIKGSVHPFYSADPQVKISVTNPDNKVVFSQNVWIDEQTGIFEKDLGTSLGYPVTGTYFVTVKYKDSEVTKSFEYKAEQKPADLTLGQSNLKFPTIKTNKVHYSDGDAIIVSGSITEYDTGLPIQLQILDPKGSMVDIAQSQIRTDGTFYASLKAGGSKWVTSGQYEIRAQYDNYVFSTYFDYEKDTESVASISSDITSVQEENKRLQQQVSSLRLQVQTLENKIDDLNAVIREQIMVIYTWVTTR